MATLYIVSAVDKAKSEHLLQAIDNGELPAMTTITKRPSDFACWQGVFYAGQWYPPSDPRGAELAAMRYMLPALASSYQPTPAPASEWWEHDWKPEYRYSQVLARTTWYKAPAIKDRQSEMLVSKALDNLEAQRNERLNATVSAPQPAPAPRSDAKQPVARKEPSPDELRCRRLSKDKNLWDAMWDAQQRWHEDRLAGEAKRNAFVRASAQPVNAA